VKKDEKYITEKRQRGSQMPQCFVARIDYWIFDEVSSFGKYEQ
jgi:hypothetical protein